MKRISISNHAFFYLSGFIIDCVNYIAILSEVFLADSVLEATEFQMGLLGAISALGYSIPCIWTGLLSERVGRRNLCLFAVSGLILATLITPHVSSMTALYAVSCFRSFSISFYWAPLMAWMAETSDRGGFSGMLGGFNISWTLGCLAGFLISGISFQYLSPVAPFHIAASVALLQLVLLLATSPSRLHLEPQVNDMAAHQVQRYVRQGYSMIFIGYFLAALTIYLFPKVVGDQLGEASQSLLHVCRMGGQLIAFWFLARTVVWHFKPWMAYLCSFLLMIGMVLIWATNYFGIYALGFALLGIGGGVGYMMSAYYSLALMRTKGLGSGIQETLVGSGNFAGPLYGGQIAALTSPRTSIISGLIPLFIVWAYMSWPRKHEMDDEVKP